MFDDFLNNKECNQIIEEMLNQPKYDDKVMVNRNRIFKGSKNFNSILENSKMKIFMNILIKLKHLNYSTIFLIKIN